MDRLACVDLPALPLQLVLQKQPAWREHPAAVVRDENRPQAEILWLNEAAQRAGISTGMSHAAALALAPTLRAGAVSPTAINQARQQLHALLNQHSPRVETLAEEPGIFFLDASGLRSLYRTATNWARGILQALNQAGWEAKAAVGFSRFGAYTMAKVAPRALCVSRSPAEEQATARRTPLALLGLPPPIRDALGELGVATVGDFLALPADGLLARFGQAAFQLHRLAQGETTLPIVPAAAVEPLRRMLDVEPAEANATRLLFLIKSALPPLLKGLAARQHGLAALELKLFFEHAGSGLERLLTAAPTLDTGLIIDLVRLRLERKVFPAPVCGFELTALGAAAPAEQLRLFRSSRPKRDGAAANRALARLRAEFGEQAVVRARLTEKHLPEASFIWEPVSGQRPAQEPNSSGTARQAQTRPPELEPRAPAAPDKGGRRMLIRRIYTPPLPLPPFFRHGVEGWVAPVWNGGAAVNFFGPYVVSGGWWGKEVRRDYYFVEVKTGELLWIYYDRRRRRWFLQGRVE